MEILTFVSNGNLFAVNSVDILSIEKAMERTDEPRSNKYVDGLVKYRGDIITRVNMSKLLFGIEDEINYDIVCQAGTSISLGVNKIFDIEQIEKKDLVGKSKFFDKDNIIECYINGEKGIIQLISLKELLEYVK